MAPSPRLLILFTLGVAFSVVPMVLGAAYWPLPVVLWVVVLLGALVDASLLFAARPSLTAQVPPRVGVGDGLEIPTELRLAKASLQGKLRADLRPEVAAPLEGPHDATTRAGATTLQLDANARGEGTVDAIWSRVHGPLGLVHRVDRHVIDEQVAVVPSAIRIRRILLSHLGARESGGHLQKKAGDGGELDSLAKYEAGMDLRKVDWKATARHQELKVRRFRLEQNQRVVLCVDTGRLMADTIDELERLDHALHAMLALAQVALRGGDKVGLFAYDSERRGWLPPTGGMAQLGRIRETVARLEPTPTETNHVLGVHQLLSQLKRRSLVIVFTEFTDPTTAELMVERISYLAPRHLVVFVALEDPALSPSDPATDTVDLARRVVAGDLRRDRDRVLRRLSRVGVHVVSGPPEPATLRLLARYLDIKRRGQIG